MKKKLECSAQPPLGLKGVGTILRLYFSQFFDETMHCIDNVEVEHC
jgi:hypothetical protein